MEDTIWCVPFDTKDGKLESVYRTDSNIAANQPFTVSLEYVHLSHGHKQSLFDRLLHEGRDVLILSTSSMGGETPVDRVHYFDRNDSPESSLQIHDLLSDTVYLCDSYSGHDRLYVRLQVMLLDTGEEHKKALDAFTNLATSTGSIFPAILPYTAMASSVLNALSDLVGGLAPHVRKEIVTPLDLRAPGTAQAKTLQLGRYVLFSDEIDGVSSQGVDGLTYRLLENGQLERKDGKIENERSYAVLRIDAVSDPAFFDDKVQQHVASLLTQFQNESQGIVGDPAQTALGSMAEMVAGYHNYMDLQKYYHLLSNPSPTPQQQTWMEQISSRSDLQPFLPQEVHKQ